MFAGFLEIGHCRRHSIKTVKVHTQNRRSKNLNLIWLCLQSCASFFSISRLQRLKEFNLDFSRSFVHCGSTAHHAQAHRRSRSCDVPVERVCVSDDTCVPFARTDIC